MSSPKKTSGIGRVNGCSQSADAVAKVELERSVLYMFVIASSSVPADTLASTLVRVRARS